MKRRIFKGESSSRRSLQRVAGLGSCGLGLMSLFAAACGGAEPSPVVAPISSGSAAVTTVATATAPVIPPLPVAPKLAGLSTEEESPLDRSVSPCENFFEFACGTWNKTTQIPDDESSWMRSFSVIHEQNEAKLHAILEGYKTSKAQLTPEETKLKNFYASCMDEAGIDKLGAKPLETDLQAISAAKTPDQLARLLGKMHAKGMSPFFGIGSQQDFADSTKMIGAFDQAGLGLPDKDYYFKDDGKFPELRKAYLAHIEAMLTLLGDPAAKASAAVIFDFEKKLATLQMNKEDRREPKKVYHLTARENLEKVAPLFPWKAYLGELSVGTVKEFNIAQPAYMAFVGYLISGTGSKLEAAGSDIVHRTLNGKEFPPAQAGPNGAIAPATLSEVQLYLRWQLLRGAASALSKPWVDQAFKWQQTLKGTKSLPPRWKRCVRATDGAMGEALAKPFVMQTLGLEGKANVHDMIVGIEGSMQKNLEAILWMDAQTKAAAQKKLGKIANKIAFPDKWRDYSALSVSAAGYYANGTRSDAFEQARQLAKIGKPVDRNEWYMTPPAVNAYYDPSMNEMVFPAGILQSPFYAKTSNVSTNFGGIGMVMGHELTHGFDDEGRQFDADGNLKDWWSEKVNTEFEKRAACVESQFSDYEVVGSKVNGKLTLGENIADLGGVKLSYHALFAWLAKMPDQPVSQAGDATAQQRFFLGFAQSWCGRYREEALRLLVTTNSHSPPQFRVNGPLSNLPEFAEAFACKPGHKMVRSNACQVW